jgi:hypothetical protein
MWIKFYYNELFLFIFSKCLKVPILLKLIWGMGRGIYGILGHKILTKVFFLLKDKDARQLGLNTSRPDISCPDIGPWGFT